MNYFRIVISPDSEISSGVLVVENFHPRWKEGARELMKDRHKVEGVVGDYATKIGKWTNTCLGLRFSDELGLEHISLDFDKGLDLVPRERRYVSHNIHSPTDVVAAAAVVSFYTSWLGYKINDLK